MKVRTTALVLALAMSVSLLSACGGKDNADQSAASTPSASVSTPAQSAPDASTPDASALDASTPNASAPDASTPDASAPADEPVPLPEPLASLALNKTDFTLFKAGETYTLKAEATGIDEALLWTSSDENVATVSEKGIVTAVAPGTATITVSCGDLTVSCIVRCNWATKEQSAPDASAPETSAPDTSAPDASAPDASAPSTGHVDLAAFYNEIMASGGDSAPAMMEVTGEYLDAFYPGLSEKTFNQCVVYTPMISAVACEIAMVECTNASDAEAVKAIFQTRIDNQVAGGAWYPATIAAWENNSKIVVKGNYVALFVIPEGLMDAAAEFSNRF